MSRSVKSFKISPPPPLTPIGQPSGRLNFWKFVFKFFPFPLLRPKLFSNAPPNFYVKGRISHRDFLHIDQALNLDLVDLSFWAIRFRKGSICLKRLYIKRCNTCIPLERLHTSCSIPHPSQAKFKYPHPTGTDDDQMSVGCRGGGGVEALNWFAHNARGFHQHT